MKEKTLSLRDTLLSSTPTLAAERVRIDEWDADFDVRSMTAGAQLELSPQPGEQLDMTVFYFGVIVACCYDPETGEPVFQGGDEAWLKEQAPEPIRRLAEACLRVSGLDAKAVEQGKDESSPTST